MNQPIERGPEPGVTLVPPSIPQSGSEVGMAVEAHLSQRVHLFGTFSVLDGQGAELAPQFTPRLQQLFLLLLLNSFPSGKRRAGTSVEMITTTLWSEADVRSAKNSRGVAMKSLRELLADAGPVRIENDHRAYMIRFGEGMWCDYAEYRALMKLSQEGGLDAVGMEALESLVARGPFLADVHHDWLDAFKTEVMFEVTRTFLEHVPRSDDLQAVRLHVRGLETVLAWDPLNEQAMRVAVRGMTALGMHGDAKRLFSRFVEAYREDLGRPFAKSLDQILNS
jgi:two-component SAPR family response regulator